MVSRDTQVYGLCLGPRRWYLMGGLEYICEVGRRMWLLMGAIINNIHNPQITIRKMP